MKLWAAGLSVVLTCACAATSVVRGDTLKNGTDGFGENSVTVSSTGIYGPASIFVGQYNWTDTTTNQPISTFCIQMGQFFSGGQSYTFANDFFRSLDPILRKEA